MAGGLASINIRFRANLSEYSTEMQNILRTTENVGAKMQGIGSKLSLALTAPILAAGGIATKYASDVQESMNKVDVAFGQSANQVQNFAKTSLESYGIAEGSALDMASLFGDMATSMGLAQPAAAKMSTSLVGLAGDLSSFKNIGIDQATTALNGIFTGETESLKRLGVVKTEANLSAYALSQGMNKQVKDMTEAEKVQLRYNFVLEKTKNAHGDFERTGGGAANQSRMFSEILKEIGASFGSIILPYFTQGLTALNGLLQGFNGLSDGTKKTIVVIGGLAAAIGPLLYGIGTLTNAVPSVITGFDTIKKAFTGLIATLAANPFTALAVGVGAVATALYVYSTAVDGAVSSSALFEQIREKAVKSVAREKAEIDSLIKVAKNEKLEKQQREAAIKKINELSPEYLGNLTLETVSTKKAEEALKLYNQELDERAMKQAILSKKTELFQQKMELQNKALQMTGNYVTDNIQSFSDYVFSLLGVETQVVRNSQELERLIKSQKLNAETATALRNAYAPLVKEREKDIKNIDNQIKALDSYGVSVVDSASKVDVANTAVSNFNNAVKQGPQSGSIAFYEKQISQLEKFRNEHNLSALEYEAYANKIKAIQEKIDLIKDPTPTVEPLDLSAFDKSTKTSAEQLKIQDNEALIASLKELQQTQVEGSAKWLAYQSQIDQAAQTINAIQLSVGVDTTAVEAGLLKLESFSTRVTELSNQQAEEAQRQAEINSAIGQELSNAFSGIATSFVDSMGLAKTGMQGFLSTMMSTVIKLISMALASSLANSISGATASGASTGPAAVFTTPAFIATAVGGVLAAFAAIPKFETGGIVGGSSYYGDKILARVNSGELILNQKQQHNLYGMMQTADASVINLVGGFEVTGDKLRLLIDRADKKNNRLS